MSYALIALAAMIHQTPATSNNPLFPGWYADPEIHVFENRYYVYPTYSAPYEKQTFLEARGTTPSFGGPAPTST